MSIASGMRMVGMAMALIAALDVHAADVYPATLPPQESVRAWLGKLPEVKAARAGIELEQANAKRLRAGPYEWTAKGSLQRRNERDTGTSYRESALALERPLRWFGKADKDAALGEQRIRLASYSLADAWHEAGRAFLQDWFDVLRETRAAARLQEQVALYEQQVELVRKRFKAGDAPRLEVLLLEAERDRAVAEQRQATQRAARAQAGLRQRYAGAELLVPTTLPAPQPLTGGAEDWTRRMLAENHEVAVAQAEAEFARLNAERAALERKPDPTLGMHVAQERGGQERIVGVTISIPIAGPSRHAQEAIGAREAFIAGEKARQVQSKAQREAGVTAMTAEAAYDNWERLSQIAAQSQATTALVSKAYSLGEVPVGDLILSRRQSLEAGANAEAAQIDALQAQAKLLLDAHMIWDFDAPEAPDNNSAAPALPVPANRD